MKGNKTKPTMHKKKKKSLKAMYYTGFMQEYIEQKFLRVLFPNKIFF